jgi:hypothetical protein
MLNQVFANSLLIRLLYKQCVEGGKRGQNVESGSKSSLYFWHKDSDIIFDRSYITQASYVVKSSIRNFGS